MHSLSYISLLGLFFGFIGTTLGGIIGVNIKVNSNKYTSFILEFAAGLMTAVICFNLLPESLCYTSISGMLIGTLSGIATMFFCQLFINNNFKAINSNLLKTGIIIGIGLTLHNLPEGLAIGAGFSASKEIGLSLAIAICIHDIPEGISMSLPLQKGGMSKLQAIIYTSLSRLKYWNRCVFRCSNRKYFTFVSRFIFKFCSWCYVIYCFL